MGVLVSPLTYKALLYGGLVLAGTAALIAVAVAEISARRKRIPAVTLANQRPPIRVMWRWLPALGIAGGLGASYWLWRHSTDVVIVTDGETEPSVARHVWIGGDVSYRAAEPGYQPSYRDPTWILNQSSKRVTAQKVGYGDGHTFRPVEILPGAAHAEQSVDYIGPWDTPPSTVTVSQSRELAKAGTPTESRVWLSW